MTIALSIITTVVGIIVPLGAAFAAGLAILNAYPTRSPGRGIAMSIANIGCGIIAIGGTATAITLTWAHSWWMGLIVSGCCILAAGLLVPIADLSGKSRNRSK